MRLSLLIAALVVWTTLGIPTATAIEPDGFMGQSEIEALVSGQTFDGEFEDGARWREAYHADGSLDYDAHGSHWVGDWHASGEMFCTFYRGLTSGGCYYIRQVSQNCFHFFIAGFGMDEPTLNRTVEDRQKWYARGYRTNAVSTCPSVGVS